VACGSGSPLGDVGSGGISGMSGGVSGIDGTSGTDSGTWYSATIAPRNVPEEQVTETPSEPVAAERQPTA